MSPIVQLLTALDDVAWEALSSKGLLRRANKEILKGVSFEILVDTPFVFEARVQNEKVAIPATGVAKASCTCNTVGCCQHVIIAGLLLRSAAASKPGEQAEPPAVAPVGSGELQLSGTERELVGMDSTILQRWSGRVAWQGGVALLVSGAKIKKWSAGGMLVVCLEPVGAECRFFAGAGLEGAIVSGDQNRQGKVLVVAAVLGLKAAHGEPLPKEALREEPLAEVHGAPRTRQKLLAIATELMEGTVAIGLAHVGAGEVERFATLAVSSEGCNLPRLARALKSISEELDALVRRQGGADYGQALERLSHAYALASALRKSDGALPAELVGRFRSGYEEVPLLSVIAVTAYPWQSRSGYQGVTVLFWDTVGLRWLTWTEARGAVAAPHFKASEVFDAAGPWACGVTVRSLLLRRLHLVGARLSAAGRLSSSSRCQASFVELDQEAMSWPWDKGYSSWSALRQYLTDTTAVGLRTAQPSADWVVLKPARWAGRHFNRVQQRLNWTLLDKEGDGLILSLVYSEMTQQGIERLETWEPPAEGDVYVVGRLLRSYGVLAVEPIALFQGAGSLEKGLQLHVPPENRLLSPSSSLAAAQQHAAMQDDESLELGVEEMASDEPVATDIFLRAAKDYLQRSAEAGGKGADGAEGLSAKGLANRLVLAGLPVLGQALPANRSDAKAFAVGVLKASYLLRLHEQCQAGTFSRSTSVD